MYPMVFIFILTIQVTWSITSEASSLEVVHIIFRHGDKNAELDFSYPTDPYRNITQNHTNSGQLNKVGKNTMHNLGYVLRHRYSNFLSKHYVENEVEAWASSISRTMLSLQIVMASLFQPYKEEIWNGNLNWQPTVFHSNSKGEDTLFLNIFSKQYLSEYNKVCRSKEARSKLTRYQKEIRYIRKYSGLKFGCTREAYILYLLLESEVEGNLTLPKWTERIYPEPLRELLLIDYQTQISTGKLKTLLIGDLLQKISSDTRQKLNGKSPKKFYLYAGHDVTIIHALSALGFDTLPKHIPDYGACLALEIHRIEGEHILKVFYRQNKHSILKMLNNRQGKHSIRFMEFEEMVRRLFSYNSSLRFCPTCVWIILVLFILT